MVWKRMTLEAWLRIWLEITELVVVLDPSQDRDAESGASQIAFAIQPQKFPGQGESLNYFAIGEELRGDIEKTFLKHSHLDSDKHGNVLVSRAKNLSKVTIVRSWQELEERLLHPQGKQAVVFGRAIATPKMEFGCDQTLITTTGLLNILSLPQVQLVYQQLYTSHGFGYLTSEEHRADQREAKQGITLLGDAYRYAERCHIDFGDKHLVLAPGWGPILDEAFRLIRAG